MFAIVKYAFIVFHNLVDDKGLIISSLQFKFTNTN